MFLDTYICVFLLLQRLSELCCVAVTQLLMLGKSVISSANKTQNEDEEVNMKVDWPEDSVLKAKIVRAKVQSMAEDLEAVSNSFVTGKQVHMVLNLLMGICTTVALILFNIHMFSDECLKIEV